MLYDPLLNRECHPFSQPPKSHRTERDDDVDRQNSEDDSEAFIYKSTIGTLHRSDGCMHCRVYNRHIDESSPDCGLFPEPPSYAQRVSPRSYEDGIRLGRRLQEEEDYQLLSRYRDELRRTHEQYANSVLMKENYRDELGWMREEVALLKDQLLAIQIAYDDITTDAVNTAAANSPAVQRGTSNIREPAESREDPESLDEFDYFETVQQINIEEARGRHDFGVWREDGDSSTSESEGQGSPLASTSESESSISSSSDDTQPSSPEPRSREGEDGEEFTVEQISSLMEAAHVRRDREALEEVRLLIQDAERTHKSKRTAAQLYLLLKWRSPSPSSAGSVHSTLSTSSLNSPTKGNSLVSPEIFVDASAIGIGFVLNEGWLAWSFVQGHPDIPMDSNDHIVISWAELIAAEMGILTVISAGYHNTQVILRSDNEGVITAFGKRTWTKNFGLDTVLKRVLKICQEANLVVVPSWIPTKANPADKPSRGVYPPKHLMFAHSPEVPSHLQSVLKAVGN